MLLLPRRGSRRGVPPKHKIVFAAPVPVFDCSFFCRVKQSGGLHNDMAVHDFDMARFLVGSEVAEVYCKGSCKVSGLSVRGHLMWRTHERRRGRQERDMRVAIDTLLFRWTTGMVPALAVVCGVWVCFVDCCGCGCPVCVRSACCCRRRDARDVFVDADAVFSPNFFTLGSWKKSFIRSVGLVGSRRHSSISCCLCVFFFGTNLKQMTACSESWHVRPLAFVVVI